MAARHAAGIDRVRVEPPGADRHRLSRADAGFPAHPVESWMGLVVPRRTTGSTAGCGGTRSGTSRSSIRIRGSCPATFRTRTSFRSIRGCRGSCRCRFVRSSIWSTRSSSARLIVSSVSFVLGLKAVERLTTALAGRDVAVRTIWLIAVFPFSFFFTAVYADALYFCLCAWSLTLAYERRWYPACALAAMAAMTRIPGLALFPALGLEYLRQNDWRIGPARRATACIAILLIAPLVIGVVLRMALRQSARVPARAAGRLEPRSRRRRLRARLELLLRGADLSLQRARRVREGVCADAHVVGRRRTSRCSRHRSC